MCLSGDSRVIRRKSFTGQASLALRYRTQETLSWGLVLLFISPTQKRPNFIGSIRKVSWMLPLTRSVLPVFRYPSISVSVQTNLAKVCVYNDWTDKLRGNLIWNVPHRTNLAWKPSIKFKPILKPLVSRNSNELCCENFPSTGNCIWSTHNRCAVLILWDASICVRPLI